MVCYCVSIFQEKPLAPRTSSGRHYRRRERRRRREREEEDEEEELKLPVLFQLTASHIKNLHVYSFFDKGVQLSDILGVDFLNT